jgi:hypothetical protein
MYLVTSPNLNFGGGQCASGCSGLIVWGLYGTIPNQLLSSAIANTTFSISLAPSASQPSNPNSIDSGDVRISGAAYYSSASIYASLTTRGAGAPACILYQIKPFVEPSTGGIVSATILNESLFGPGYYCTQQPDPEGNVTTVFNLSDAATYPSLVYMTRRAATASDTFADRGIMLQNGLSAYGNFAWGRYTATAPAGIVSGGGTGGFPTFWFAGMYTRSNGTWGTAIGKNGYSNITQE